MGMIISHILLNAYNSCNSRHASLPSQMFEIHTKTVPNRDQVSEEVLQLFQQMVISRDSYSGLHYKTILDKNLRAKYNPKRQMAFALFGRSSRGRVDFHPFHPCRHGAPPWYLT